MRRHMSPPPNDLRRGEDRLESKEASRHSGVHDYLKLSLSER